MKKTANVLTVDGPGGAGKGTLCQTLADLLGWHLLDSGAIYRVLALAALQRQIDLSMETALTSLAVHLDVGFCPQNGSSQVILEGEDVSDKIRTGLVAHSASQVASFPKVREALLERQRAFQKEPGLIADGRDMGTLVFPDATVKIFLNALPEERARRRMLQLQKKGFNVSLAPILAEMKERDHRDITRQVAPLLPAADALIIDSTAMSAQEVVKEVLEHAKKFIHF